jgi:hypothetical protein
MEAIKDIKKVTDTAAVRDVAAGAMPDGKVDYTKWWKHRNLRALNLLLIFPLCSIFTLG